MQKERQMRQGRMVFVLLLLVSSTLICVTAASATDITWNLNNVTFNPTNLCCGTTNEGAAGTATGFFVDPSGGTASGPPISGPLVNLTSWDIITTDTGGNPAYGPTFDWNPTDSTAVLETDAAGNIGIGLSSTAICSGTGQQPTPCRTMGLFTDMASLNPSSTPIPIDNGFGLEAVFNCNTGNVFCDETSRNYLSGGTLSTTFVVPAPEPGSLLLLATGLAALVGLAMWKKGALANLAS
jgi:PEP-CTERM motif